MIKIFPSKEDIYQYAADQLIHIANDAINEKGFFTLALTGGSSPKGLYELLTEEHYKNQIDWSKVYVFWGDERWVSLDDELSNAKMSFETLLNHVPVLKENIFPMYKEGIRPEDYALEYESILKEKLGSEGAFDLVLLGMGNDGHTASLFPGTEVLDEKEKWVSAYYLAPQEMYRITLTAVLLNQAKQLLVIAFGESKAEALEQVIEGESNFSQYPSQLLNPSNGELLFLVDEAAATQLKKK
ncbi:6-phosphogluconolactonase [Empedobacter brevis]|uniref:6-phosphogluconolactonase n=1 Tax=Empedobacter brevis TaxID=247 RepID=UPI0039AFC263